jgi:hypothetical protein
MAFCMKKAADEVHRCPLAHAGIKLYVKTAPNTQTEKPRAKATLRWEPPPPENDMDMLQNKPYIEKKCESKRHCVFRHSLHRVHPVSLPARILLFLWHTAERELCNANLQ